MTAHNPHHAPAHEAAPAPHGAAAPARDIAEADRLESPVTLVARTYHTIDHAVEYLEGDTYSTSDGALVNTVIGCGFAALAPPPAP